MADPLKQQQYIDDFFDEYNEFPSEQQLIEWAEANDYMHEGDDEEPLDEIELFETDEEREAECTEEEL